MYKTYEELSAPQEKNRDLYSVEEINDITQKRDLLSRNLVVCVDVYANWCGPCKQTEPSYALLASQHNEPGKCAIVKENYEKKLSEGVGALPTYIFYIGGRRMRDEIVGADLAKVEEKINYYKQNGGQILRQMQAQGDQFAPQASQGAPQGHPQGAPQSSQGAPQGRPNQQFQQVQDFAPSQGAPYPPQGAPQEGQNQGPFAGKNIRNYRPTQQYDQGFGQPYQPQQSYHQPYQG